VKVVILAGGYGTRIASIDNNLPKPMLPIGGYPVLYHIMKIYSFFGHKDFYIALGYKAETIKKYFRDFYFNNSDLKINLNNNQVTVLNERKLDWNVNLIDTGLESLTAKRLRILKKYIGNNKFLLTYGDGLSNIDINKLIEFHNSHKKIATVTAVRPTAKFGDLEINGDKVVSFNEKNQLNTGWISGGFFVFEPEIFDLLSDNNEMLERTVLKNLAEDGNLLSYKHNGFWQCMDTQKDYNLLQELWKNNPIWHRE